MDQDKQEKQIIKHLKTKLNFRFANTDLAINGTIQDFRDGWTEWNDNQRLEVIKSLVATHCSPAEFYQKAAKAIDEFDPNY